MCLNPWDPQTMRIFTTDETFHALFANEGGGGMSRDGVLVVLDSEEDDNVLEP